MSTDGSELQQHTRGAAAAPVSSGHPNQKALVGHERQHTQSIVCPIYQSKDFRLMTGQQPTMSSASKALQQHASNKDNTKTDQKDVKRGSEADRKEGNKGGPRSNAGH